MLRLSPASYRAAQQKTAAASAAAAEEGKLSGKTVDGEVAPAKGMDSGVNSPRVVRARSHIFLCNVHCTVRALSTHIL